MLHLTVEQFAIVQHRAHAGLARRRACDSRAAQRSVVTARVPAARRTAAAGARHASLSPRPAFAQETREEERAARRREKATQLHPYEPDALERRIERIEQPCSTRRDGPSTRSSAACSTAAAVRSARAIAGDSATPATFDAHAAWSFRNYKAVDATVRLPTFADGRVRVDLNGNWLDAPTVAFYRHRQRFDARTIARDSVLPRDDGRRLDASAGGALPRRRRRLRRHPDGNGRRLIAADRNCGPDLSPQQRVRRVRLAHSPGYASRGGLYRVEWSDYRQTNAGAHSFSRVDAEAQQFVPLVRENSVHRAARARLDDEHRQGRSVPFFLLPDLGGSHTLRGYPSWRFRDRNRLLLTAEYRWTAGPFVDMALFVDAGKVAPRLADLDLQRPQEDLRLGMSLHTPATTITRIELARTREGTALVVLVQPELLRRIDNEIFNEQIPRRPRRRAFGRGRAGTMLTSAASPKFYADDPVWIERDTQDASSIKPLEVDLFVDLTSNLVAGQEAPVARRAANVNTVDEVPDSSWFTNRARPSAADA